MRANPHLSAINAGEFSPRMDSRSDFAKYPAAAKTLYNCYIDERGGIFRRPGTRHIGEVKDSTKAGIIIPFIFSDDQSYMIEAGPAYFRWYIEMGRLDVVATGSTISNGTFNANITGWSNVSEGAGPPAAAIAWNAGGGNGMLVLNAGTTADTQIAWAEQAVTVAGGDQAKLHVLAFRVRGVANEAVEVRIGTSSKGAQLVADRRCGIGYHLVSFTPGTGTVYVQFRVQAFGNKNIGVDDVVFLTGQALEITTPYAEDDLPFIRWDQAGDFLYLVDSLHSQYRLLRYGHRDWSLEEIYFADGPYLNANANPAHTLDPGATTGFGVAVVASKETFKANDVGRKLRVKYNNLWGHGVIVGVTDAKNATIDVKRDFLAHTATKDWALGAWGGDRGFPEVVTFADQRAIYGGSVTDLNTLYMSQAADIENMMPDSEVGTTPVSTVEEDDALVYRLVERRINRILGMLPGRDIQVFTGGGELAVSSSGITITTQDIGARLQTAHGSAPVAPVKVDTFSLFVQRARRRLMEFAFDVGREGYVATDLTVLAEHITRSGIERMAYAQDPNSILHCVLGNGTIAALTYKRDHQVVGWSRQTLGGRFNGRNAVVEDVAIIPGNAASGSIERDEVWLLVKRTINGATKRYIEVFDGEYDLHKPLERAVSVDSALVLDNWNADPTKALTLTASLWKSGEAATMTATGHSPFLIGDVGQVWHLRYESKVILVEIIAHTSASVVTVKLLTEAPEEFRAAPILEWLDHDAKVTSVSGLGHLEGQTVKVVGDGAVQNDKIVSLGQIELDEAAGCVIVGLGYDDLYESLRLDYGGQIGPAVMKPQRINKVTVNFLFGADTMIGPRASKLVPISTRKIGAPIGLRPELWQGEFPILLTGDWSNNARIVVKGSQPRPWFILSLAPELLTNDVGP